MEIDSAAYIKKLHILYIQSYCVEFKFEQACEESISINTPVLRDKIHL